MAMWFKVPLTLFNQLNGLMENLFKFIQTRLTFVRRGSSKIADIAEIGKAKTPTTDQHG